MIRIIESCAARCLRAPSTMEKTDFSDSVLMLDYL